MKWIQTLILVAQRGIYLLKFLKGRRRRPSLKPFRRRQNSHSLYTALTSWGDSHMRIWATEGFLASEL